MLSKSLKIGHCALFHATYLFLIGWHADIFAELSAPQPFFKHSDCENKITEFRIKAWGHDSEIGSECSHVHFLIRTICTCTVWCYRGVFQPNWLYTPLFVMELFARYHLGWFGALKGLITVIFIRKFETKGFFCGFLSSVDWEILLPVLLL